jgi:hypothetical protein
MTIPGSGTLIQRYNHRHQPPASSISSYNVLYIANTGSKHPDHIAIEAPPISYPPPRDTEAPSRLSW